MCFSDEDKVVIVGPVRNFDGSDMSSSAPSVFLVGVDEQTSVQDLIHSYNIYTKRQVQYLHRYSMYTKRLVQYLYTATIYTPRDRYSTYTATIYTSRDRYSTSAQLQYIH